MLSEANAKGNYVKINYKVTSQYIVEDVQGHQILTVGTCINDLINKYRFRHQVYIAVSKTGWPLKLF